MHKLSQAINWVEKKLMERSWLKYSLHTLNELREVHRTPTHPLIKHTKNWAIVSSHVSKLYFLLLPALTDPICCFITSELADPHHNLHIFPRYKLFWRATMMKTHLMVYYVCLDDRDDVKMINFFGSIRQTSSKTQSRNGSKRSVSMCEQQHLASECCSTVVFRQLDR